MNPDPKPPVTRTIGEAERTLRSVLERHLGDAGLTFPEWTTLVFLGSEGPLDRDQVIERLLASRIVAGEDEARRTIDHLASMALVGASGGDDARIALTAAGQQLFVPLRSTIGEIVDGLTVGVPAADLDTTIRTLATITSMARAHLAA